MAGLRTSQQEAGLTVWFEDEETKPAEGGASASLPFFLQTPGSRDLFCSWLPASALITSVMPNHVAGS